MRTFTAPHCIEPLTTDFYMESILLMKNFTSRIIIQTWGEKNYMNDRIVFTY